MLKVGIFPLWCQLLHKVRCDSANSTAAGAALPCTRKLGFLHPFVSVKCPFQFRSTKSAYSEVLQKSGDDYSAACNFSWIFEPEVFLWCIGRFFRDFVYDTIADNRYNVLGKQDTCRLYDDRFRERFVVDWSTGDGSLVPSIIDCDLCSLLLLGYVVWLLDKQLSLCRFAWTQARMLMFPYFSCFDYALLYLCIPFCCIHVGEMGGAKRSTPDCITSFSFLSQVCKGTTVL